MRVAQGKGQGRSSAQGKMKDAEPAEVSKPERVPAAKLAAILATPPYTDRWLRELADKGYLVKSGRAEYELAASVQGYIRYIRETEMGATVSSRAAYDAERARKLKLDNDRKENLLISTELVIDAVDHVFGMMRTDLAGIPAKASDDVATRRRVENAIDDVLNGMADRFGKAAAALGEGRNPFDEDAAP